MISNPLLKVTSGAADTAPQLRKLLDLNVTSQTVRNTLRKAGLKSARKPKKPILSRACRQEGWSCPGAPALDSG